MGCFSSQCEVTLQLKERAGHRCDEEGSQISAAPCPGTSSAGRQQGPGKSLAGELPSIPLKAMVATNLLAFVLGWREERACTQMGRTVRATEANEQSKKKQKSLSF